MEAFRPRRVALCVYESLRLVFLVGVFILLQPLGNAAFPWLALITPEAMFLLMAVFWMIDMPRYRVFCPLYLAGKGIGVITFMLWLFFPENYMIQGLHIHDMADFIAPGIVVFLTLGDIFSAWLVIKMGRSS